MDIKVKLSTLWIFASLNYIYADIFNLFFVPGVVEEAIGFTGGSYAVPLVFAIIMETALLMVLFSRLLPYTINKWTNIFVGALHTALILWTVFEDTPEPFYAFFGTVEIITTLLIIWYAWKWRKPKTEKV